MSPFDIALKEYEDRKMNERAMGRIAYQTELILELFCDMITEAPGNPNINLLSTRDDYKNLYDLSRKFDGRDPLVADQIIRFVENCKTLGGRKFWDEV